MKTITQLDNEIKVIRKKFCNGRTQFEMRRSVSSLDRKKEQKKEFSLMEKRQNLERQKTLLKDLIALGIVKEK